MKKKYYLFKININLLNIVSLILLLVMFIFTNIFFPDFLYKAFNGKSGLIFLILLVPYLLLHELLHGFSYVIHGAKFKNITFGAHLEKGVLCCLCKQNINKKNIMLSLIYPFFFIGVITYFLGFYFKNYLLMLLSIMNIGGCSGDLIMFFNFLKLKNIEYSEYDDPISFGLYSENDLSKIKMVGLEYVDSSYTLKRNDLKKIFISRKSIYIFILLIVLLIILTLI